MDNKTKLFGTKTKGDWLNIRTKIISNPSIKDNWVKATDLLKDRLITRYFRPIERILKMRITTGEGFAAMTLMCSIIEFLQSCYEGKTYEFGKIKKKFTYNSSADIFKEFLLEHEPFKSDFSESVANPDEKIKTFADDFYLNVRCGLLHEAATKNNWIIKTHKRDKNYINLTDELKIIYRDEFFEKLKTLCDVYCNSVIDNIKDSKNRNLRDNFCRKLDSLCEISDDNAKWWQ